MTSGGEWRSRVGSVWAEEWRRTDRAFAGISARLDEAIEHRAPSTGVALDIGCGAGSTSLTLARARPALEIVGADISPALLVVARGRLDDERVTFIEADALTVARSVAPIDFLYSRHGVMFFDDPVAAFTELSACARPGASLVFSTFQARALNDWATVVDRALDVDPAAAAVYEPGPFAFSDRAFVTELLSATGWGEISADAVTAPWVVGSGDDPIVDALHFLSRIGPAARPLAEAASDRRRDLSATLARAIEPYCLDGQVRFTAAAWIWTARARRMA